MLSRSAVYIREFFLQGLVSRLQLQGRFEVGDSCCLVSLHQLEAGEGDMGFGVRRVKANRGLELGCGGWGLLFCIGFAECAVDFANVRICFLQGQ